MNKPTRYNIYTDAQSNCFCEMEVHSEGEFVDWHEYKELQAQLAKFTPYINHTPECIAHEPSYKSQCDCGLSEVIDTSQESE